MSTPLIKSYRKISGRYSCQPSSTERSAQANSKTVWMSRSHPTPLSILLISQVMLYSPVKARFLGKGTDLSQQQNCVQSLWLQCMHLAGKEEVIISSWTEKLGQDLFPFCTHFWHVKMGWTLWSFKGTYFCLSCLPMQRWSLVSQFGRAATVSSEESWWQDISQTRLVLNTAFKRVK